GHLKINEQQQQEKSNQITMTKKKEKKKKHAQDNHINKLKQKNKPGQKAITPTQKISINDNVFDQEFDSYLEHEIKLYKT
ncbi:hypothetical protein, partial [Vibrio parahaemolyticus]|uniref:hypothetical protein n=1 Tax=Vibrio parahaemolyticus TaxID=670 RepID=UPI0021156945